jgi:predicted PurR-regulated permease PerM
VTPRRVILWRIWLPLALCLAAAVLLRAVLWRLLLQVLLGALLAYALSPLCKALEKRMPKGLAALCALLALLLGAAAFLLALVPPLVSQARLLAGQAPALAAQLRETLGRLDDRLAALGLPALVGDEAWARLARFSGAALQGLANSAGGMASGLAQLSLATVLAYYFLKDRAFFLHRLAMLVPLKHRKRALLAAAEVRREVGGYLRGQLLVCACVGALTALGLRLVGIQAWLALGLLMAILDVIPYFGPFLGAIPVLLFSLPGGMGRVLWALGVVLAAQQLEGNLVAPRLLGQHVGLHPVAVILALSAGGALLGIWGMVLALPVAVSVRGYMRVLRCADAGRS